uniref:SCAN box domain-containing protein n=1 Tax=Crocodylus porosus TaxID=8502 RepID=A0A7M4EAK3_CROPO
MIDTSFQCIYSAGLMGFLGSGKPQLTASTKPPEQWLRGMPEAILYRLEISPETYRQKFRAKEKLEEIQLRMLAQLLNNAATQWIQPASKTTKEVVDLVILEQFIKNVEVNTQKWVKRHQPRSLAEALKVTEDYLVEEERGGRENTVRIRVGTVGRSAVGVTGQGGHFKIAHSGSGTRNRTAPELRGVVGLSQPQSYAVNVYMCSPDWVNPL